MTAFAPVFSRGVGCKYRPKKAPRTKAATMLIMLARLGFAVAVAFIAGALLGLIPLTSETPRLAMSVHQTQDKDNSRVAVDSVSSRAARVAKRKTSFGAAKRAAKTSSFPQASR
jgi:hypothetical protein